MGRKPERTEPLKRATYTMRVDQIEFLRTQPNASQFVRDAIDKIMQERVSEVMTREAKILQLDKQLKEIEVKNQQLEKEMWDERPGAPPFAREPYKTWNYLSSAGKFSLAKVEAENPSFSHETLLYMRNLFNAYNKQMDELRKQRKKILKQMEELAPG